MNIPEFINYELITTLIRVAVTFFVGLPLVWVVARMVRNTVGKHVGLHLGTLASNIIFYAGLSFIIISILNDFGFQLSALLGAAGILGIAVGFAAQTSVSNIISGIFLLLERAFSIGDTVICDSYVGTVQSIDLLSVKIKTFDGQLVRIPNEFFVKKAITNRSYFPIRRFECRVRAPLDQDMQQIINLIHSVLEKDNVYLKQPGPLVALSAVTGWSKDFTVRVWTNQSEIDAAARGFIRTMEEKALTQNLKLAVARV